MTKTNFSKQYLVAVQLCVGFALASTAVGTPVFADSNTIARGVLLPTAAVETAPHLVPNFDKVAEGIWRGAAPSDEALEALAVDGVKTIVDLRMDGSGVEKEEIKAKELGIRYYHFPLGFSKPANEKLKTILSIMTNPTNQPVFIHCRQGADRTGMLVGLYRRIWSGWSFRQTWREMREHHFKPFLTAMKKQVKGADTNPTLQQDQISSLNAPQILQPGPTVRENNISENVPASASTKVAEQLNGKALIVARPIVQQ